MFQNMAISSLSSVSWLSRAEKSASDSSVCCESHSDGISRRECEYAGFKPAETDFSSSFDTNDVDKIILWLFFIK